MPPSMIQEIQPYFETKQFHQEKLNLQVLRLVLPIPNKEAINGDQEKNTEGSWSSLYSLSAPKDNNFSNLMGNSTYKSKETQPPPTSIFKKTKFGTKNNLDICTETLGCENGTVYTTEDYKRDGFLSDRLGFVASEELEERRREKREMAERRIKRVKTGTEFPPALKTRTGETCVNLVKKRENGRIVMYTVNQQSKVQVERKNGRLRLSLPTIHKEKVNQDQEEKNEINGGDEMEKMRVVIGRCKEGKKRENWESFWVASS